MLVKDQLNRAVDLPEIPKRIVSLVPSQTELLVDLGLASKLVGVTKFCVHPHNLRKESTVVGGTKKVDFDKIRKLQPDIIICNKEENTEEIVAFCSGIAPVWVSDIFTLDDALMMISQLGEIFNVSEKASEVCVTISKEAALFSVYMKDKPVKKVAYLIWKNPYMIAGKNTFINAMLAQNKFENILSDANTRYPEVSLSELRKVDLVLLSSEPYPFKKKHIKEIKKALQKEVLLIDGEYFSWYGSRLQNAFTYFKSLH
ncbi:ABC transporter substrate-binding protein [Ulvibacter litoralis]|uniref:ABC-type Fe3+-hydroxamate transport system, substrate-binding protein n=1 Tax=Ulvibacter litoralis TaxID=227084 RepID=A0A1G7GPK5_9FLAO|nr:helical backbone metal receptor [Ulvibacter litoralis]GHC55522.1 iron ABC transporter [Ulvibacter litoralis]SDE90044.1 ABC-type Fe3+-hydroxamate transport system, substrate-binding protein [Ulvibacter litoralis]